MPRLIPTRAAAHAHDGSARGGARLIEGSLELDMAALTGESQPVVRSAAAVQRTAALLESEDVVFAGTLCTGGDAAAVVFAAAMTTVPVPHREPAPAGAS
jgi:E1-E2 ATPase